MLSELRFFCRGRCACAALFLLLTGCASLSTTPPDNYALSGQWQLNAALSDSPSLAGLSRVQQGNRRPPGSENGGRSGPQGRNSASGPGRGAARGAQTRVASLEAKVIKIEQSFESMGMEFDGGSYRDVSWGKRKRGELTVETGWQERDLIINTTGGRMPTSERYVLSDNFDRLTVYIELNGGRNDLKFKRVFDKVAGRSETARPAVAEQG